MRVGTQADDFSSELLVAKEDVLVQFRSPSFVILITFCVDFQCFTLPGKIAEHQVEKVAEIFVEYTLLRIWGISGNIVEMAHDVKIPEPGHFLINGFKIMSICLFPASPLIISPVERICAV